jgi:hypothetical protein
VQETASEVGSQEFDEGIGDFGTVVICDAHGCTFHVLHQSIKIVARVRNTDHADGGAIPQFRPVQLRDGNVETSAQAVFQAAHDLPPIFDRLRRFNMEFESKKRDGHSFKFRASSSAGNQTAGHASPER